MKRTVGLLLVLAAGACSRTPTPEVGELRVTPLGGEVRLVDGGETSLLDEATTVDAGIGLLTGPDGRAKVELPGGDSVELAPSAEVRVDGEEPQITRGSVLVSTGSDITVHAGSTGDAEIAATDAVFRVDSDISVILAVYQGEAAVLGSGVSAVPALREVTIVGGSDIHSSPKPIQVRPNDPWDARLLGEYIDLGLRLAGLERGLTKQLPARDEVTAVSRVLGEDFPTNKIRNAILSLGDAARAVVAAVVANQVARLNGGDPVRALHDVVDLYLAGARWIVIAAEWGLAQAAVRLLEELDDFAGEIQRIVAPPPADGNTTSTQGPNQRDRGPSGPGGGGGGGDNPPPKGGGPGGKSEPPPPPPPEGGDAAEAECANAVECAVDTIIGTP